MKHGKRPTVRQKKLLNQFKLNPDNWLIITENKEQLKILQKNTNKTRVIKKLNIIGN